MISIKVNQQTHEVKADTNVAELLEMLQQSNSPCAVVLNGALLPKAAHAQTGLQANDQLDLITPMQGG